MRLPPEIQALLSAEKLARSIPWLELEPDLCGAPIVPLTARMVLDLSIGENSFFSSRRALRGDVFGFLWRCSPYYRRPLRPEWMGIKRFFGVRKLLLWVAFGSRSTACQYVRLEKHVNRLAKKSLWTAESQIVEYIQRVHQDIPAAGGESKPVSPLNAQVFWLDELVEFFWRVYGSAPSETLDLPIAALLQVRRQRDIIEGRPVIDPSHGEILAHMQKTLNSITGPIHTRTSHGN